MSREDMLDLAMFAILAAISAYITLMATT